MSARLFVIILVTLALLPHAMLGAAGGSAVLCTTDDGHAAIELSHSSCPTEPDRESSGFSPLDDCTDARIVVSAAPYPPGRVVVDAVLPCPWPLVPAPAAAARPRMAVLPADLGPAASSLIAWRTISLLV